MSGELQTIPARHGVATFVPRGRTIKVINTYGQQVISMWAFTLGAPPEEGELDGKEGQQGTEENGQKKADEPEKKVDEPENKADEPKKKVDEPEKSEEDAKKSDEEAKKSDEEAKKNVEALEKSTDESKKTDGEPKKSTKEESTGKETETTTKEKDAPKEESKDTPPSKRRWTSYLPSIPYRSKGPASESSPEPKPDPEVEKAQNEAKTKKWTSYLPTGKGFSSYVPNPQSLDSSVLVSAFKSSHYRDPNKSYAEQLYDFSKTPVGAGTIAAATGSGYASSVYAAYNAYAQTNPSKSSLAPMEYLSLPHTRASSRKLVPDVNDTLLTNLRNPIITLLEDTTPGAHDTLTAACDANLYATLGIEAPAEHGSCAENLVLALKELNEKSGLTGAKAVGADISVNIAPTPLHLFMNAPLELGSAAQGEKGVGAKGAVLSVSAPVAKKRSFVRFRAERDVVVVFSACPMDVGPQNGGRCMAANFMVEEAEGEDLAASNASVKGKRNAPKLSQAAEKKVDTKKKEEGKKVEEENKKEEEKKVDTKEVEEEEKKEEEDKDEKKADPEKKDEEQTSSSTPSPPPQESAEKNEAKDEEKPAEQKAKKKPKKLQVRSAGTPAPAKGS
ncbi:hypothetical protein P153DRAFT_420996 [Dothidotthia symphoricarpi CBS 119687]|uniref:DUF1989 domain-containing protein n=1 Tax=Dothidotthia symphoricarpi CBS 119687 TaxID=1392245 RepID=A0A6A6AK47_9PLEO|nr:uncharacterized protein P153DRAFT_420996 [Dothidotthia symphoricarpi CBS 119687]KAF2131926.1 hypothetical protein P153DRAFT_420996 [Dothidotthia symphoricarpi CBS 119687]